MKREEAEKLNVGDRVIYRAGTEDEAHGEVESINPGVAVFVAWDDGMPGAVHVDDMANYSAESIVQQFLWRYSDGISETEDVLEVGYAAVEELMARVDELERELANSKGA